MSEENVKDFAAEGGEALLFSIDRSPRFPKSPNT